MVPDVALILLGCGFTATLLLALAWGRLAPRWRLLAHPNARSFHAQPRLTGAGVAFALPLLGYLGWLAMRGSPEALALAAGGGLLAAIGLLDDAREVSAGARLLAQALVAGILVWVLLPAIPAPWLAVIALGLVWHVNVYNFMDGIDGLAAAQGLVFAVGAQVVGLGLPGWAGDVTWLTAGCMVAFLAFNFPPSRMFMGDVGSALLGLLTGALALLLWQQQALPLPAALILLSVFWLDASYTLIVRVFSGQAFTQAHRSHLYQKLAARRGHLWTTVCFVLYAVTWLLPWSWVCARQAPELSLTTPLWLLPAVTPVLVAAWWLGAGLPETRPRERDA